MKQYDKEHSIRPMKREDVPECIKMTLESFGTKDYPKEQFETIEEEFYSSFESDWWVGLNILYLIIEVQYLEWVDIKLVL